MEHVFASMSTLSTAIAAKAYAAIRPSQGQDDGSSNPLLQGHFAPLGNELNVDEDLPVTGQVPRELRGQFVVNSPNFSLPVDQPFHLFMGDGMLHGVTFRDGRAVRYRNRWINTARHAEQFGLDQPRRSHANRMWTERITQNRASTHVIQHADKLLALFEAGLPYEVTRDLETVGEWDFAGKLHTPITAHPKTDPATGELIFFGIMPVPPTLTVHFADAQGNLIRSERVSLPDGMRYMHDVAITLDHLIFYDLPVDYDPSRLSSPNLFPYKWDPDGPARVGVMPRRPGGAGEMKWFDVGRCNVMHFLNAYDDGDQTIVDVVRWPTNMAGEPTRAIFTEGPTTLDRWVIDRAKGQVSEVRLDDHCVEFPRIDERRTGQKHRYGYALEMVPDQVGITEMGDLLQYDLLKQTTVRHSVGRGRCGREGVFVPYGSGELDGWILSFVYDRETDRSDLAIIDAANFAGPPVALVHLPQRVPFGFHGSWVGERA